MLILTHDKTPRPCALPGGVVLHARPATRADWDLARARARAGLRRVADGSEALARYGVSAPDALTDVDGDVVMGLSALAVAIELAVLTVSHIDGLVLPDGRPAQPTLETFAILFNVWAPPEEEDGPPRAGARLFDAAWLEWQEGQAVLPRARGEPCAPAPTGDGAGVMNIVPAAPEAVAPAPTADAAQTGGSAPMSSTPP